MTVLSAAGTLIHDGLLYSMFFFFHLDLLRNGWEEIEMIFVCIVRVLEDLYILLMMASAILG